MTKLKTLKDLFPYNPLYEGYSQGVRQEAIKWIKELQKNTKTTDNEWNMQSLYPIQWIKNFFNITEEELK